MPSEACWSGAWCAGGPEGGAAYVRYRVWGSVGYIIIAIGTGLLVKAYLTGRAVAPTAALSRADLDPVFLWGPLLFFVIAAISLFVPDAKTPPAPAVSSGTPPAPGDTPAPVLPAPATPPNLDRFLVAYFLYQFSLYGASAFLSIYIKSLGASPEQVTAMFAAGVVCEVLVMSQVGRWTDTHGRRPALVAAFLLMPVRLLLYIPAAHLPAYGPLWVLGVQTLHGLNFGIVGTIAIVFVNDHATDANRGRLQARLAASAGLGAGTWPARLRLDCPARRDWLDVCRHERGRGRRRVGADNPRRRIAPVPGRAPQSPPAPPDVGGREDALAPRPPTRVPAYAPVVRRRATRSGAG